jgi:hypothetical protein
MYFDFTSEAKMDPTGQNDQCQTPGWGLDSIHPGFITASQQVISYVFFSYKLKDIDPYPWFFTILGVLPMFS